MTTGPLFSMREKHVPNQHRAIAFDVDPASLLSLRQAFPGWEIEAVHGSTATALTQSLNPGAADLLVVGAHEHATQTVGLCRALRRQAGRELTPLLVLLSPAQRALAKAALEAGADGCLVLPVHAREVANMVLHTHAGNRPGWHTFDLGRAALEDRWRDDGGQG